MAAKTFGQFVKSLRIERRQTLRDFCATNGIDPGNWSRLERGRFAAPHGDEILQKYASALGISRGTDQWIEFFDLAAVSRGQLPSDLLADEELLEKLPALFRTLRGTPVAPEKLDDLIDDVRRS
jgi:transcriptional regulator with XRE-family HTH domain